MNSREIRSKYGKIFESYPKINLETHVRKLIELDEFYPYNNTFYCITNTISQQFEYVSKNFKACTGLDKNEMLIGGMKYFWTLIHPDDISLWISCLEDLMRFTMNELSDEQRSKMSYTWNYRIKNSQGNYVNVIQNTTPVQFDENKKPVIGLAHYTIIDSSSKPEITATAKYLNESNEYETLFHKNISNNLLDVISNRERDIIRLLLIKKTSNEIAESLNISKHTVDTHRRNILKKLNLISTVELANFFKQNRNLL